MARTRQVVFASEWMPRYRHDFYERLIPLLADDGIDVSVYSGQPPGSRAGRGDAHHPDWVTPVTNRFVTVGGRELTWQPVVGRVARADLAIVQHETGLLANYPLLALGRVTPLRTAIWGHGEHPVAGAALGAAETVKRVTGRLAHHVFAYTERSQSIYLEAGYDDERITVVQNSRSGLDPVATHADLSCDVRDLVERIRRDGGRLAWMASALDGTKRLPFLVAAADEAHRLDPTFELAVMGDGDDRHLLDDAATTRPWLHVLGARFGADKSAIAMASEVCLQPGLIGLHVIDTFAAATPMVTTRSATHSHEFDYLDATNAVVLDDDATAEELGRALVDLLHDPERLATLRQGCRDAAKRFSLETMVDRFRGGVLAALG